MTHDTIPVSAPYGALDEAIATIPNAHDPEMRRLALRAAVRGIEFAMAQVHTRMVALVAAISKGGAL